VRKPEVRNDFHSFLEKHFADQIFEFKNHVTPEVPLAIGLD
jgi:hypothetical protein